MSMTAHRCYDSPMLKHLLRLLAPRARASNAPAPRGAAVRAPVSGPWTAVSINPGSAGCAAARRFGPRRFLRADAPRLPLPECAAEHCDCRYRHHADRRSRPRRRSDTFGNPGIFGGTERRSRGGGRRASDE